MKKTLAEQFTASRKAQRDNPLFRPEVKVIRDQPDGIQYVSFPKTFWIVTRPTGGEATLEDVVFETSVAGLQNQFLGGLKAADIVMVTTNKNFAMNAATDLVQAPE